MAAGGKIVETVKEVLDFLATQNFERGCLANKILSLVQCGTTGAIPAQEVFRRITEVCSQETRFPPKLSMGKKHEILQKWIEVNEKILNCFDIDVLEAHSSNEVGGLDVSHDDDTSVIVNDDGLSQNAPFKPTKKTIEGAQPNFCSEVDICIITPSIKAAKKKDSLKKPVPKIVIQRDDYHFFVKKYEAYPNPSTKQNSFDLKDYVFPKELTVSAVPAINEDKAKPVPKELTVSAVPANNEDKAKPVPKETGSLKFPILKSILTSTAQVINDVPGDSTPTYDPISPIYSGFGSPTVEESLKDIDEIDQIMLSVLQDLKATDKSVKTDEMPFTPRIISGQGLQSYPQPNDCVPMKGRIGFFGKHKEFSDLPGEASGSLNANTQPCTTLPAQNSDPCEVYAKIPLPVYRPVEVPIKSSSTPGCPVLPYSTDNLLHSFTIPGDNFQEFFNNSIQTPLKTDLLAENSSLQNNENNFENNGVDWGIPTYQVLNGNDTRVSIVRNEDVGPNDSSGDGGVKLYTQM